ncbi:unnamed protein product [Citrullus colocynthis]|uniref:DYW domain-containing protein n=1 Tax=Citrullus colocynthis TaxID=252529 RepID=A0ABP0Z573_9ROSI
MGMYFLEYLELLEKNHGKIEIDGVIHEFAAGELGHPEAESIWWKCNGIYSQPKLPDILLEVGNNAEFLNCKLQHHRDKLAPMRILRFRSLKIDLSCEDRHKFMKLVSKIYQREIRMKGRFRFHYFRDCYFLFQGAKVAGRFVTWLIFFLKQYYEN